MDKMYGAILCFVQIFFNIFSSLSISVVWENAVFLQSSCNVLWTTKLNLTSHRHEGNAGLEILKKKKKMKLNFLSRKLG